MDLQYKNAILKVHRTGVIERKNMRTKKWFTIEPFMDVNQNAVFRIDYKYVLVSHIVAIAYFGINTQLNDVFHINHNKLDNSVSNLQLK
jgi:hypothetical protein